MKNGARSAFAQLPNPMFTKREVDALLSMTNKLLSGDTPAAQAIARSAPGREALGKLARLKRGTTELQELEP